MGLELVPPWLQIYSMQSQLAQSLHLSMAVFLGHWNMRSKLPKSKRDDLDVSQLKSYWPSNNLSISKFTGSSLKSDYWHFLISHWDAYVSVGVPAVTQYWTCTDQNSRGFVASSWMARLLHGACLTEELPSIQLTVNCWSLIWSLSSVYQNLHLVQIILGWGNNPLFYLNQQYDILQ
jgi:hypothetical protein